VAVATPLHFGKAKVEWLATATRHGHGRQVTTFFGWCGALGGLIIHSVA